MDGRDDIAEIDETDAGNGSDDAGSGSDDGGNDVGSAPVVKTREEMRKALRDKIKALKSLRAGKHAHSGLSANIEQNMNSKQKRKASKQVESRSIDDILNDFGITSSDAKGKVVKAMQDGSVKTLNDLVGFVASLGGAMPKNNALYGGAAQTPVTIDNAGTTAAPSLPSHTVGQPRAALRAPPTTSASASAAAE